MLYVPQGIRTTPPLPPPLLAVIFCVFELRDVRPEGDARISWIEAYLSEYPGTVILDPVDKVANCINRITTLEVQKGYIYRVCAARCYGSGSASLLSVT